MDLRNILNNLRVWSSKHSGLLWFLAAGAIYAVCTLYYMGGVFAYCTTQLTSGPGDQTAGLIWLNSIDHIHPFWGFTHVTNYPLGEQLSTPVYASGSLLYLIYFGLAKVAGSVCGYNLLNALGYLSAALVMFGLVRWLTRKPWIALLAGYVVSFTPYLQIKTSVHPSYVYQGLLIGIVWLYLVFWLKPRLITAIAIGALVASSFYVDPYFVLLTGVLAIGLLVSGIAYDWLAKVPLATIKQQLKYLSVAIVTFGLLLMPLVFIRVHYSAQINNFVSSSRNDIKFDSQIYGAHPLDYIIPVESQPVLKALIPNYAKYRDHHNSNPAEYSINLSLTLVLVVFIGLALWIVTSLRQKKPDKLELATDKALVVGSMIVAGALAFMFSLVPIVHGHHMPSWFLTNYVTMWRVFARLYVVVNITLVIMAAIALAYLATKITKRWLKAGLLVLVFTSVAFEYQTFNPPRQLWSYTRDVPQIYYQLHDMKDIKVIAEYSLDEQPVTIMPTYYLSYQRVHGKQLLNSDLPNSSQGPVRGSIRDLYDPQSIPTLRALGVDALVVHGVEQPLDIPGLQLVTYQAQKNPDGMQNEPKNFYPIAIYKVLPGQEATYVVAPLGGFVYPKMISPISYDYVAGSGATLSLIGLPGQAKVGDSTACFSIRSETGVSEDATITQGGTQLWSGVLGADWLHLNLPARLTIPLTVKDSSTAKTSLIFDKLGCQ